MRIQGSVNDEGKFQKWNWNVIYMLLVHKEDLLLLMKKRVMACFRVTRLENVQEGIFQNVVSFWLCVFSSPCHHLFVKQRGHSQLSLRKVRTAAPSALPILLLGLLCYHSGCDVAKPEGRCPHLTLAFSICMQTNYHTMSDLSTDTPLGRPVALIFSFWGPGIAGGT